MQTPKPNRNQRLIAFVLEKAAEQSVPERVELYRAAADITGDVKQTKNLNELADQLERTDKLCREFTFNFTNQ